MLALSLRTCRHACVSMRLKVLPCLRVALWSCSGCILFTWKFDRAVVWSHAEDQNYVTARRRHGHDHWNRRGLVLACVLLCVCVLKTIIYPETERLLNRKTFRCRIFVAVSFHAHGRASHTTAVRGTYYLTCEPSGVQKSVNKKTVQMLQLNIQIQSSYDQMQIHRDKRVKKWW